tara:strand:+ start:1146 stop:3605 length:2460 start_codon:yes stop_codon:yes gene_type:complete
MLNDEELLLKTAELLENFDIFDKKPEKLLREITDQEYDVIVDVIEDLKGEDLAFNDLFGGKMRKIIDFPTMDNQSELGQFVEELEQVLGLTVDWEKGLVSAQRQWTEASIENDEAFVSSIMGSGDVKTVNRKFQMKIGKYFAKLDKLLQDYKKIRQKIAHEVWDGRQDNAWGASFSIGQIRDALSTDELKRLYQIQNGLELYAGTDSISGLRKYYGSYEEAEQGKITKLPELAKYWQENAGYIKKNIEDLESNKYSIILTRHPVDVMRMSDFDKISSCHSPPSRRGGDTSYYKCAVAEARGHGAVAYVVETEALDNHYGGWEDDYPITRIEDEEEFQKHEIFDDAQRAFDGPLTPLSRVRLRQMRYYDSDSPKRWDEGTELAVPETRTYGAGIPGLVDRVTGWAQKNQASEIENMPKEGENVNLERFWIFGGSYEDTAGAGGRRKLLANLTGVTDFEGTIRQNSDTEDAIDASLISNIDEIWADECGEIASEWNRNYAACKTEFAVEDDGGGDYFIQCWGSMKIIWDKDEWARIPSWDYDADSALAELREYGWGFINEESTSRISVVGDKVALRFKIDTETPSHVWLHGESQKIEFENNNIAYSPDGYNEFCQTLDKVDDLRDNVKAGLTEIFKREGFMVGAEYMKLAIEVDDGELSSYEWDVESDGEREESYQTTATTTHYFDPEQWGVNPQILFDILDSRDWKLEIRKELLKRPRSDLGVEYYLPIVNASAVEHAGEVKFDITFGVTADDPDEMTALFKELVTGDMDDEDTLSNLFNWTMKQILNARLPASIQQNLDEHLVRTWKGYLGASKTTGGL